MRPKDGPPSFQFYARDFLSSTSVVTMTPEARGGYVMLLAHAWLQRRPGWLPDDDVALSALSGLNGRWPECREMIRRAFRVRKGWWIQARMVNERRAQHSRFIQAQKGARVTNGKRWGSVARRPNSESLSGRTAVAPSSASAFASAIESKETPSPQSRRAGKPPSGRIPAEGSPILKTNLGEDWQPTQDELDSWVQAYPALDVIGTIREAQAWLVANPSRRKTFSGMARYVNGWLAREQNRL